jgi:hypothetical protein
MRRSTGDEEDAAVPPFVQLLQQESTAKTEKLPKERRTQDNNKLQEEAEQVIKTSTIGDDPTFDILAMLGVTGLSTTPPLASAPSTDEIQPSHLDLSQQLQQQQQEQQQQEQPVHTFSTEPAASELQPSTVSSTHNPPMPDSTLSLMPTSTQMLQHEDVQVQLLQQLQQQHIQEQQQLQAQQQLLQQQHIQGQQQLAAQQQLLQQQQHIKEQQQLQAQQQQQQAQLQLQQAQAQVQQAQLQQQQQMFQLTSVPSSPGMVTSHVPPSPLLQQQLTSAMQQQQPALMQQVSLQQSQALLAQQKQKLAADQNPGMGLPLYVLVPVPVMAATM